MEVRGSTPRGPTNPEKGFRGHQRPRIYLWGYSSAGRAHALQAWGRRFESDYLHQYQTKVSVTVTDTFFLCASPSRACSRKDSHTKRVSGLPDNFRLIVEGRRTCRAQRGKSDSLRKVCPLFAEGVLLCGTPSAVILPHKYL